MRRIAFPLIALALQPAFTAQGAVAVHGARPEAVHRIADTQPPSENKLNAIDARIEAAAVTAALVRALSTLLIITEDMAKTANKPENRDYANKRALEFKDAIDMSVESYQRLIGEIAVSTSGTLLDSRLAVVQREMGQRGQGPVASVFPVLGEHIRAIQGGAASSNNEILQELLAVSNR